MKTIKLLIVLVIGMVTFTSCKKDRVCQCTLVSQTNGSVSQTNYNVIYKDAKRNATKGCIDKTETYNYSNATITQTYKDCIVW